MKAGLRVDGGPSIGLGHLIRCSALAFEFQNRGVEIFIISRTTNFIKDILNDEFEIIPLKEIEQNQTKEDTWDYGNIEMQAQEIKEINEIIKKYDIDILIIDSYNVSDEYFIELKKIVPFLCYIDDLNKFKFSVDMIINGNVYAADLKYKSHLSNMKLLLGNNYTILRNEFKNINPITIKEQVTSIMITLGGSDPFKLTKRIIDIINSDVILNKYQFNFIIGKGFKDKDELRKMKSTNIIFHEIKDNISDLMLNSDLAVSGGGATLYELARCGVPTIAFIIAENQEMLVEKMHSLKCIERIGWYNKVSDDEISNRIKFLVENHSKRHELHNNCLKLIDGLGAERIVNEIISSKIN
jgi:UDP-2,4-diacetamido-2,4,6-trideoxy-beta-L-altropyranose hydrolase